MGANGRSDAAANLTYAKFLFLLPEADDAATLAKIRSAGSNVSRIFFNDYDADGTREPQPQETIQFLSADAVAKPCGGGRCGTPDRARSQWASSEAEVRSVCPSVARPEPASQRASGPGARIRDGAALRLPRVSVVPGPPEGGHYVPRTLRT